MINFIGIGFSRTGSTWLSRCLAEHPDICFSKDKETHFFNLDPRYAEGSSLYESYFDHCKNESVQGEFTAVYARESEKVAPRIYEYASDVKLLVMLRNPVERAFSNYMYRKTRVGGYKSFEDVVEKNDPIIQEGFYMEHLKPFLKLFSKEQFIFIVQEESRKDPKGVIKEVYSQLGVDSSFEPSCVGREINASKDHVYKLPWLQHAIQRVRMFVHRSKILGPVRNIAKTVGLTKIISRIQQANGTKGKVQERMLEETRVKLMRHYLKDIEELETVTGLNLQIWKK